VRSIDRNHDGRADYWEVRNSRGYVSRVLVDSNLDGRPDLVQDFDPELREHVRSVVDTDFDGSADRVELYQHERLVAAFTVDSGRRSPSITPHRADAQDEGALLVQKISLPSRHVPGATTRVACVVAIDVCQNVTGRPITPDQPRGPPPPARPS
jgi:hypothetical protein